MMTDSGTRTFLALPLSETLQKLLFNTTTRWWAEGLAVRPVPPQNIHLTLCFLGLLSTAGIEALDQDLQDASLHQASFDWQIQGVGLFPNTRDPRILWAGVKEKSGEMLRLKRMIDSLLSRHKIPIERRPFTPHITLARFMKRPDGKQIAQLLDDYAETQWGWQKAESFHLVKSTLNPSGAVYETLRTFPLRELR